MSDANSHIHRAAVSQPGRLLSFILTTVITSYLTRGIHVDGAEITGILKDLRKFCPIPPSAVLYLC
jgi:hypothetical protein